MVSVYGIPNVILSAEDTQNYFRDTVLKPNAQTMSLLEAPKSPFVTAPLSSNVIIDETSLSYNSSAQEGIVAVTSSLGGDVFYSSSDQISVYVVREGDTLDEIANMYGVTSNTIRWANDLTPKSTIKKDQRLVILPVSGIKYVVKKGDSLSSIAKNFKGDKAEIISFNDLGDENGLVVGKEIIIPNGEISQTAQEKTNSTKTTTPKNMASKGSTKGYFLRPVIGGIKTQGLHGHNGVDIAAKLNTPILASASGQVIVAKSGGWNGGYGSYVVISHPNGMQTLYGHLNLVNVSVGDSVKKGDVIGGMGNTGKSTGVHLHFEVRGGTNPF